MISIDDIRVPNSKYRISLLKLIGKGIADIQGSLSREYGDISFVLSNIVFDDGTEMGIEGEHDFPYVTEFSPQPQPNFDEETLERLYLEDNE